MKCLPFYASSSTKLKLSPSTYLEPNLRRLLFSSTPLNSQLPISVKGESLFIRIPNELESQNLSSTGNRLLLSTNRRTVVTRVNAARSAGAVHGSRARKSRRRITGRRRHPEEELVDALDEGDISSNESEKIGLFMAEGNESTDDDSFAYGDSGDEDSLDTEWENMEAAMDDRQRYMIDWGLQTERNGTENGTEPYVNGTELHVNGTETHVNGLPHGSANGAFHDRIGQGNGSFTGGGLNSWGIGVLARDGLENGVLESWEFRNGASFVKDVKGDEGEGEKVKETESTESSEIGNSLESSVRGGESPSTSGRTTRRSNTFKRRVDRNNLYTEGKPNRLVVNKVQRSGGYVILQTDSPKGDEKKSKVVGFKEAPDARSNKVELGEGRTLKGLEIGGDQRVSERKESGREDSSQIEVTGTKSSIENGGVRNGKESLSPIHEVTDLLKNGEEGGPLGTQSPEKEKKLLEDSVNSKSESNSGIEIEKDVTKEFSDGTELWEAEEDGMRPSWVMTEREYNRMVRKMKTAEFKAQKGVESAQRKAQKGAEGRNKQAKKEADVVGKKAEKEAKGCEKKLMKENAAIDKKERKESVVQERELKVVNRQIERQADNDLKEKGNSDSISDVLEEENNVESSRDGVVDVSQTREGIGSILGIDAILQKVITEGSERKMEEPNYGRSPSGVLVLSRIGQMMVVELSSRKTETGTVEIRRKKISTPKLVAAVVGQVKEKVKEKVKEILPEPVKETTKKVAGTVALAADGLKEKVTGIGYNLVESMAEALPDDMVDSVESLAEQVGDTVSQMADSVSEKVEVVTDSMAETVSDLTETVSGLSDAVSETVSGLSDSVSETVSELSDSVQVKVLDLTDKMQDTVDAVQDTVDDITGSMQEKVMEMKESVGDKVQENMRSLGEFLLTETEDDEDELESFTAPEVPELRGRLGMDNYVVVQEGTGPLSVIHDFYIYMLKMPLPIFSSGMFFAPICVSLIFTLLYLPDLNGLALDETAQKFFEANSGIPASPFLQFGTISTVFQVFMFSVSLSTGLQPELAPLSPYSLIVANVNALVAELVFVFLSGAVFARLSQPSQPIRCAKVALVCPPSVKRRYRSEIARSVLMCRYVLTGPQPSELVDVKVDLTFKYNTVTRSGSYFRAQQSLKLVRPEVAYQVHGMLVRHVIDESSPLFHRSKETLMREDAIFCLSVVGLERSSMQSVFHVEHYSVFDGDIVWNAEFEDMVLLNKKNKRIIDQRKLSNYRLLS